MGKRLDNAIALYMEGIRDGRVREAVTKYTGDRYTQHSTGVADGVEGFVTFFEDFIERVQHRDIRVVRALEDGQYVFCQVSQDLNLGEARWVTTDLFDTDDDGKIIEHWDVIAPWTSDHQIDGPTEVTDLEATEPNKRAVSDFVQEVLIGRDHDRFEDYVAPALVQHELGVAQGVAGWRAHLEGEADGGGPIRYQRLFRSVGQGSFVVTYCEVDRQDTAYAVFDIFRLASGRIVERWSNAEPIPADTGNSGKF